MTPNEELRQIRRSFKNGQASFPIDREVLVNCTEVFALSMTDTDAERLLRQQLEIKRLYVQGVTLLEWSWGKSFVLRYLRWPMRRVRISYRISPDRARRISVPRPEKAKHLQTLFAFIFVVLFVAFIVLGDLYLATKERLSKEAGE